LSPPRCPRRPDRPRWFGRSHRLTRAWSRRRPARAGAERSGTVAPARLPSIVERTAYLAAADLIAQAISAGTDELTIAAVEASENLVVEIRGTDVAPTTALCDRVGALGGQIIRTAEGIRVAIPCG
jgi:hypothetical protein